LLINFLEIPGFAHQTLPLVVANSARALIMLLLLALLPAGRYLGPCIRHPRRWMFVVPAVLAACESARSIGSIYHTHIVASAIVACIALTFAVDFPNRTHGRMTARRLRWFCVATILAVSLAHAILKPNPFFAYSSIDAVRVITKGLNPYKVDLDPFDFAFSNTNEERFKGYFESGNIREQRFRGYKYSPLLPAVYFPLVKLFGDSGVLLSNGIVLALVASTVSVLCWRIMGGDGVWAAILLLASPAVVTNVLVDQVNDLVAVLPMCMAFLVWESRPGLAGLLLGASASIKVSPAPIAMALLLPQDLPSARRFMAGIAVGLIPTIVFAALDPVAFFNNVVLFEIVRPTSPNSLLGNMPSTIICSLRIGFMAIFLSTAAAARIGYWSVNRRIIAYVVLTIILLLTSQTNFDNYWLWWIPLFLPLLCARWVVAPIPLQAVGGEPASLLSSFKQPNRPRSY